MRSRLTLINLLLLLVAIFLAGCSSDGAHVDAASEILPDAEPLTDLVPVEVGDAIAEATDVASNVEVSVADDSFGAIGLLAPTLSGFGLETYTTSCDPFEDPYGACL